MKKLYFIFVLFMSLSSIVFAEDFKEQNSNVNDVYDAEFTDNNFKDEELSRLKRFYLGVYGGYFYDRDDKLTFMPSNNCDCMQFDFICNTDGSVNPISSSSDGEYFLAAAFGINSAGPFRLEFSYFTLANPLQVESYNIVDLNKIYYDSQIDVQGGSVNLYIDFIGNRRRDLFTFVPYVMAGIGVSEIELADVVFNTSDNVFHILGDTQHNKTVVYGAGLTAGLNNYISLEIGYRYYDFGKIYTGDKLNSIDGLQSYDFKMETDLKAHVGMIGLKFQI